MPEPTFDDRLIEPPPPDGLIPGAWWPWWLAAGILLLILAGLALWWRRRKGSKADPAAPQAHAKALASLAGCPTTGLSDTATQVSLILRRYLAEAVDDPALYETHEELIARSSALEQLSEGLRDRCRQFFQHLAQLKYAPDQPDGDPATLLADAGQLLQALNREIDA